METLLSFAAYQPLWLDAWQHMQASQRIHHAFLYLGTARASMLAFVEQLANYLHCLQPKDWHPCGQCASCRAFDGTGHPDALWLPARGQREKAIGMDHIRAYQHQLRFAPQWAPYRLTIMHQAEIMTEPAQHALLKTLEEPTMQNVLFLLAPSKQSLLPTIYSRCIPFHWQAPSEHMRQAALQNLGLSQVAAQILAPLWTEATPWSTPQHPMAEPIRQLGAQLPALLQAKTFAAQTQILQQLLQAGCPWQLLLDGLEATLLALARHHGHQQAIDLPLATLPMGQIGLRQIWASLQQLSETRQYQVFNLQPQACLEAIWLHAWPSDHRQAS